MQTAKANLDDRHPIAAALSEQATVAALERLLASEDPTALRLIGSAGEELALPPSVLRVLRRVVRIMARQQAVSILPVERELTTQEAADLLNVSRPYLIQLLDRGEIPHTMTGTHRRLMLDDVLAYKQRRDHWRREGLRTLARASKEMGLYDLEEV